MTPVPAVFHYELAVDVPVTVGLGLLDAVPFVWPMGAYRDPTAPLLPAPSFDEGAITALKGRSADRVADADHQSDLVLGGALVVPVVWFAGESLVGIPLRQDRLRNAATTGALAYEAIAVSVALNQLTKGAVGRPRPYVYTFGDDPTALERFADVEDGAVEPDAFASFYSGHTSTVAASTFAVAHMVAWSEPHPTWVRVVVPYALATAATTTVGALRVEAGQHFPSDVIVGGVVGATVGVVIPELHRLPVHVSTTGAGLALSGTW